MVFTKKQKAAKLIKLALKAMGIVTGVCIGILILTWWLCPFPIERLDKWPMSPTVLDFHGWPLLSIVGSDEQWRYPIPLDQMSPWLKRATIAVEDEHFYRHIGVDPIAVVRAAGQNIAARRIVSGASTLNMQLCRMMDDRPRSFKAKMIESFRALQLNKLKEKDEILELYLNTAPYGGNLRGVEAASLRYFGRHAKDLTLGQAALIAGLPQSPIRYQPDRHLKAAIKRQHVVLRRMFEAGMITELQRKQAQSNLIEIQPNPRIQRSSHAAWFALQRRSSGGHTTIDLDIQKEVERLTWEHLHRLPKDTELAVVVIDINESSIVSMIGSGDHADPVDGQVNGALAKRSPGSALKPFIYAAAFEAGRLNGESIVFDIPISRGGWTPLNFDRVFMGQLTAAEALQRSLNIPAVLIAEGVGLARCCGILEAVGIPLPPDAQKRGGLALAVGGIEVRLLELTNAYATLGRDGLRRYPKIFSDESTPPIRTLSTNVCRAVSEILSSRQRRPRGMETVLAENVPWFMWKTGTSSGRRDAWAIGHNRRYAIGVWVGRFRGTGRTAYIGAEAAEPLLAELFSLPRLRTSIEPLSLTPIQVNRPLPPPRELNQRLKIIAPSPGDTFICLNGSAIIHTRANHTEGVSWFLNDRLIQIDTSRKLALPVGEYELRCVDQSGQSSCVSFAILPSD
ncbi:MAG: penicillin-binding protein 1C [Sedimentisphaerales bacterium]|nr:penicillin-binding protein 1C [Sedimentisphaerales bacterium]